MKLVELLDKDLIELELKGKNKEEVIRELGEKLKNREEIKDFELFLKDVFAREELGSTGIGEGIALPHARSNGVKKLVLAFGRSPQGVEFNSLDGKAVNLIFLIGTPKEDIGNYLKVLAKLSRLLKKESFRNKIMQASSAQEIIEIFKDIEQ